MNRRLSLAAAAAAAALSAMVIGVSFAALANRDEDTPQLTTTVVEGTSAIAAGDGVANAVAAPGSGADLSVALAEDGARTWEERGHEDDDEQEDGDDREDDDEHEDQDDHEDDERRDEH
ncbi:hypothetical protein HRbin29_00047 [bacterium HR29]|nr:hypothetical protein HRbin29_00047 [bacterium HR29]